MGFQNAATAGELGVHAARLYSVMSPPRTGRCSPKSAGRVPYADDQLSRPPVLLSALASISLAFAPLITHVTVSEEAAAPWPQVSVNTPSPIAGNCFNAGTDAAVWREDNNRFLDAWGAQAAGLGWDMDDIFAAAGLVRMLRGTTVVALSASTATLSDGRTYDRFG